MKSGGLFTFGTNWWEPFFTQEESGVPGGITITDYLALNQKGQKVYDVKVADHIAALLMVQNCNYDSLKMHLKQQQISPTIT